jgi:hypothetical protein
MIVLAAFFPANSKGLAGRAAGNEIEGVQLLPIDVTDILKTHRPITDVLDTVCLVVQDGRDCVLIELHHMLGAKARMGHSEGQPPTAGEEFSA